MGKYLETIKIDELMNKETAMLIRLLWQREEFMALSEKNYIELIELLEKELKRTKKLDW